MVFSIQLPSRGEIMRVFEALEPGEELTDRALWILREFGGDLE